MMNESIVKAYDIIKEEQRNADTKANIFIVIISAVIAFISDIPVTLYTQQQLNGMQYFFLFLLLPLLMLVWSLVPIYSNRFNFKKKKKEELNIFYWKSIIQFDNSNIFVEKYKEKYNRDKLAQEEIDILNQIYTNANILESKVYTHKTAFYILGHILIFLVLGVIAKFIVGFNLWIVVLFVLLEMLYTNKIYGIFNKIYQFFILKVCNKNK